MKKNGINENPEVSNRSYVEATQHQASTVMNCHAEQNESVEELAGTKDVIGKEKLLVAFNNEVRTSLVIIFCITFVVVSIVEFAISVEIYKVIVDNDFFGWIVAFMMLLIGVLISHGFARYFSQELNNHYFNEFKRASEEEQLSTIRARYENDKKRWLTISIILLIVSSIVIYGLSIQRMNYINTANSSTVSDDSQETVTNTMPSDSTADINTAEPTEPVSAYEETPVDIIALYFPLFLFIINSLFIGIYVPFYLKKRALDKKVKLLKSSIRLKEVEIVHHLELFKRNLELAELNEAYKDDKYSKNVKLAYKLYKEYQTGTLEF